MNAAIILPNQLFEENPLFTQKIEKYFLIEENLFFNQLKFHKTKILYQRATMKFYENYIKNRGYNVEYIEANNNEADIRILIDKLAVEGYKSIFIIDPEDDWIIRRLKKHIEKNNLSLTLLKNPSFLYSENELSDFLSETNLDKRLLQTKFYINGRRKFNILIKDDKPVGNSWTFDKFNREKIPDNFPLPEIKTYSSIFLNDAKDYIQKNFSENYGSIDDNFYFPLDYIQAKNHLSNFIENNLKYFGPFQDAINFKHHFLFHSTISSALNIGLITPTYVLSQIQSAYEEFNIPIQSAEGFIRQILGWREYVRLIYRFHGRRIRTSNFFEFNRNYSLRKFYDHNTGIFPLDKVLMKLDMISYNHHIERLMVLGNIMLLLEIHPDDVYEFFMTNYIDAFDWVMVPNVYGMSQFADGGFMATKPYISSSKYILKMSNLKKDNWCENWDILFWNFLIKHSDKLKNNPRMIYLLNHIKKMDREKKLRVQKSAEEIKKKLLG